MPRFKHSPNRLDTVDRNAIVADVFTGSVVNSLVLIVEILQAGISSPLVGVDRRARFNAIEDGEFKRGGVCPINGNRLCAPRRARANRGRWPCPYRRVQ